MTKGVFTTKVSPAYDDAPESRYHFPNQYLSRVRETVGDWIVYYEPRRATQSLTSRGGRQSYFSLAKVLAILPDDRIEGHHYALVERYLDFTTAVPFRIDGDYFESALKRSDGKTNKGEFGHSVRLMSETEFAAIVSAGFPEPGYAPDADIVEQDPGFGDMPQMPFERPVIERVMARPFREAAFTQTVRAAYRNTCAFTGLRLINGGGRPEVQAAHIQPVASRGPDSVRNGVALSGTVHWLFDRGLISIGPKYQILAAEKWLPEQALNLFNKGGDINLPESDKLWPHQEFLKFHRNTFKG
jgi:putative restriction endonuclease